MGEIAHPSQPQFLQLKLLLFLCDEFHQIWTLCCDPKILGVPNLTKGSKHLSMHFEYTDLSIMW